MSANRTQTTNAERATTSKMICDAMRDDSRDDDSNARKGQRVVEKAHQADAADEAPVGRMFADDFPARRIHEAVHGVEDPEDDSRTQQPQRDQRALRAYRGR